MNPQSRSCLQFGSWVHSLVPNPDSETDLSWRAEAVGSHLSQVCTLCLLRPKVALWPFWVWGGHSWGRATWAESSHVTYEQGLPGHVPKLSWSKFHYPLAKDNNRSLVMGRCED